MIDPLKRHQIQVLRAAGLSVREVAARTGVARQTVHRIGGEEPVADVDDREFKVLRRVGRPSAVAGHRAAVATMIEKTPDLPTHEVLRLLRLQGYEGGKSAVYELVRSLRPASARPVVRFEGLAGEFSQHDFGHVDVTYVDGTKERLHFFASRLKYSRHAHVVLVEDERVESLVRALVAGLEDFGGVPLCGVFDNPKTIVKERRGSQIEWNATFGQAVLDLRLGVELCWPRSANQKGSVERLVGWVKSSFFKVRRFTDRRDVQEQLREWLRESNETRPSRATGVPPAARLAVERERLRPLPVRKEDFALRFPVVVGPTGFVEHRGLRYAMPPQSIGIPGTLHLFPDRVWIVAGRHEARLPRFPEAGRTSWGERGRTQILAAVSGERGRLYAKREQILEIGAVAEDYLTEIVHRRPRTWKGDVDALHELLVARGPQALEQAMATAFHRRLLGAEYVRTALEESGVA
jgi:transposase